MIGTKLAHYEITSHLGSGGMGDVYQATDSKLGRSVAIKFLPVAVASDADRLSRFRREAQVLASLNHPNIAHIYGIEESGESRCIVMELIEGETLQERIKRGSIPVDESLTIAKQIAEALEAAHEKGVIHRDLKPGNVMLTTDGRVKVLDFGLAKAYDANPSNPGMSNSPTMVSMAATNAGIIMGTAAYMSPEQAKGRAVDKRTDIFAFGAVLFEMLTGRPAFEGEDVAEILAQVLMRDPDWTRLPSHVPLRIRELLRFCLRKDLKKRRSDAADLRIDIEEAMTELDGAASSVVPGRQSRLAWGLAAVAALALAVLAAVHFRERTPEAPEMRLEITTPSTPAPLDFALSPDGRYIVFVASGGGPQRLWLRALDKTEAQPLSGTDDAVLPFWSADSRSIGYFASGKLYRIDISGGTAQPLANARAAGGGTWNADGTILFGITGNDPLARIAASGGTPTAVTSLDAPRQASHRFPHFLPDGHHFLYWGLGIPEVTGLYLGSLEGGSPKRLAAIDSSGAFLPPDWIVFRRQTSLMVQKLDLTRGVLLGDPVRLADPIGIPTLIGQGNFSVSTDGRVAYRSGGGGFRQLTWYDRSGKILGAVEEPDADLVLYPELSPDGQHVAVSRWKQGNQDIWIQDFMRGGMTRFTSDSGNDFSPLWAPDGRIAFSSLRKGGGLYAGPSSRAGAEQPLLEMTNTLFAEDWSKDGRFLLYSEANPKTGRDVWALPMSGLREATAKERKPFVVVNTPADELNGQFSPDGRWVAYETNESGRFEIVVQPFPEATGTWPVSVSGGVQPRWRADGKELYFIAPDGKLMAASITTTGAKFAASRPVALFPARAVPGAGANKQQYAVSRDGRFLINQPVEESTAPPITLILNWSPERGK